MTKVDENVSANTATHIDHRKNIAAAGGILGAIAASSCCMLPLALFSFGVGGAWIGNLTALTPYQPIFVTAALGFLGYGYWLIYREPKARCADAVACARPATGRIAKSTLWIATALIAAAIAFPYVAPYLLDI